MEQTSKHPVKLKMAGKKKIRKKRDRYSQVKAKVNSFRKFVNSYWVFPDTRPQSSKFYLYFTKILVGGADVGSVLETVGLPGPHHLRHQCCEHRDTGVDLLIFYQITYSDPVELPATGTVLMCRELV